MFECKQKYLDDSAIVEVAIGTLPADASRRLTLVARTNRQRIDAIAEDINRQIMADEWLDELLYDLPMGLHPEAIDAIKVDINRYREAIADPLPADVDNVAIVHRANRAALLFLTEYLVAGGTFTNASAISLVSDISDVQRAIEVGLDIDEFVDHLINIVLIGQKRYIRYVDTNEAPPSKVDKVEMGLKKLLEAFKRKSK